jgi:hypothetical protein
MASGQMIGPAGEVVASDSGVVVPSEEVEAPDIDGIED